MSIFDDARVTVLLADHVAVDPSGKVTALGLGFQVVLPQQTGLTAPQHLLVLIDVPSKHIGQDFSLSVELRDVETGSAVKIQGPTGVLEPLRIQQLAKVQAPQIPGLFLPSSVPARVQAALAFPNGLPLAAGKAYQWRVEIDGHHRKGWEAEFHVAGPPPPPVFGGPSASPTDIGPLPEV